MDIKIVHIGEDYSTVKIGADEFECSLGFGLALKKAMSKANKVDEMARTWVCSDPLCQGQEVRDYATLAEAGSPYCPLCDMDMVHEQRPL